MDEISIVINILSLIMFIIYISIIYSYSAVYESKILCDQLWYFRDTFSILRQPNLFNTLKSILIDAVQTHFMEAECIAGLDARGFLIGPLIALELRLPFIPIRKQGKLPGKVTSEGYTKEYGKVNDCFKICLVYYV